MISRYHKTRDLNYKAFLAVRRHLCYASELFLFGRSCVVCKAARCKVIIKIFTSLAQTLRSRLETFLLITLTHFSSLFLLVMNSPDFLCRSSQRIFIVTTLDLPQGGANFLVSFPCVVVNQKEREKREFFFVYRKQNPSDILMCFGVLGRVKQITNV